MDDATFNQNINYTYDERDRLTRAWTTGSSTAAFDTTSSYDTIGNLLQQGSRTMTYGSTGVGTGGGPHQARMLNGSPITYDANGNMTSGNGRTYTWTLENKPATVTYQQTVGGTPATEQLLSQGKTATASSVQLGNEVALANDGNTTTRWAAASGTTFPQTWQVDLGQSYPLTKLTATWFNSTTNPRSYQYTIAVSADGTTWTTVVDQSGNTTQNITTDSFTATGRYVRVTVVGAIKTTTSAVNASAYEFQVYGMVGGSGSSTVSATETFVYKADGERVGRQAQGVMTAYHDGFWEDTLGVNARKLYRFGGQMVAQRDGGGTVQYFVGDHQGSVSTVVAGNGTRISEQRYTPWGEVRVGDTPTTTLDFTGQRRDDSGLLFYNAR